MPSVLKATFETLSVLKVAFGTPVTSPLTKYVMASFTALDARKGAITYFRWAGQRRNAWVGLVVRGVPGY